MDEAVGYKRLKITQIIRETRDCKTYELKFLDNWRPLYRPGQFITLIFNTPFGEKRRSYSISSSLLLHEPFRITIKKVINGEFSRFLLSNARVGDILVASGISGLFVLPDIINATPRYFFIAAGSGITPCFPMISTILKTSISNVVLVYSSRSKENCIFYKQLNLLLRRYAKRFIIYFFFSNIFDFRRSRLSNLMLSEIVDEQLNGLSNKALFYLCGPFDYMQMARITLAGRAPAANILKENFTSLTKVVLLSPPDRNAHFVTIRIGTKIYKIQVKYPVSILAMAKKNKIILPYSCESRSCGSCVATCTQGKIWMAYNEVLTDDDIEKGSVLLCQGFPVQGDAEVML